MNDTPPKPIAVTVRPAPVTTYYDDLEEANRFFDLAVIASKPLAEITLEEWEDGEWQPKRLMIIDPSNKQTGE